MRGPLQHGLGLCTIWTDGARSEAPGRNGFAFWYHRERQARRIAFPRREPWKSCHPRLVQDCRGGERSYPDKPLGSEGWAQPAPGAPRRGGRAAATAWATTRKFSMRRRSYAIYRALGIFNRKQESGHRYTISGDSTAATDRIRSDAVDPGQHLARAAIEACAHREQRQRGHRALGPRPPGCRR